MHKRSWRPFLICTISFLVFWNFILPLIFRQKLQQHFFNLQIPVWKLITQSQHLQQAVALRSYSKNWCIDRTRELIRENAYLKMKLLEKQDVIDLSHRILELNKVEVGEMFKCLPARVIYRSYEMWSQFLAIDKGTKDGIKVGQGVICTEGIVGRISKVQDKVSFVELVSSPNFRMLVHLENDENPYLFQGVAREVGWKGSHKGYLMDVSMDDELSRPRLVETMHLGQQFPNHIYVGQLLKIKKKDHKDVGIVAVGDYIRWVNEVGVLLPITVL